MSTETQVIEIQKDRWITRDGDEFWVDTKTNDAQITIHVNSNVNYFVIIDATNYFKVRNCVVEQGGSTITTLTNPGTYRFKKISSTWYYPNVSGQPAAYNEHTTYYIGDKIMRNSKVLIAQVDSITGLFNIEQWKEEGNPYALRLSASDYLPLDGTADYVNTNATWQTTFDGPFEFGCYFILSDGQPAATEYICGVQNTADEDGFQVYVDTSGNVSAVYESDNDANTAATGAAALANGAMSQPVHVKVVVDATNVTVYLDGTAGTAAAHGATLADYACINNLYLGAHNEAGSVGTNTYLSGGIFGAYLKDTSTSPDTYAFVYPLQEGYGTIAYNTASATATDGTIVSVATDWADNGQDLFHYNSSYGFTTSSSVKIPALLDQSLDAAGNAIGTAAVYGDNSSDSTVEFNAFTLNAATYTLKATDLFKTIRVTYTQTGACTITIPTALTVDGNWFRVLDVGAGGGGAATYNITLATESTEKINNGTTLVITEDQVGLRLESDGSNWLLT